MKTITSFLSKAVLAIAGVVALSSTAYAQTQTATTRWTGTAYSSIGTQTFYLYNIGTGKFIKADGEWGIQALLKFQGFGTGLTLEGSSNGSYLINTGISTTTSGSYSKYLGINLPGTTEGSSSTTWGNSEKTFGVICDASSQGTASSTYTRYVTFEEMTDYTGSVVYRIKEKITSNRTSTEYYWGAKAGIDYATGKASADMGEVVTFCHASNSAVNDTIDGDNKDYYSWILVTQNELSTAHVGDVSKGGGLTANMSYLLQDPYFDRNRTEFSNAWKSYSTGSATSSMYRYDWLNNATTSVTPWTTPLLQKVTVNTKEYGKYSFASVEGLGVMYTTFTAPADGYYEIEMRGFSQGTNDAWLYVSTDPTVGPDNIGAKVAFPKVTNGTFSKTSLTNAKLAAPGQLLYNDSTNKYAVSVQVHASANQTVYIGIYKAAASQSSNQDSSSSSSRTSYYDTDYIGIDNLQLYYVGQLPFVLDEDTTSDQYMRDADYQGETFATVYLKRNFTLNKWNTLVMPIDLTAAQVKEAFGDDTQIAELKGVGAVTGRPSIDFQTVSLDQEGTVVEKAKMYLIKPVKDGSTKTLVVTFKDSTTKTYQDVKMYTIGRRNLNGDNLVDPITTEGQCDQYPDGQVKFVGTYVSKDATSGPQANSYVFSGGNMYHLSNAMAIKGFRGWFEDMTGSGSIKFNISDGEITSIDEVIANDKGKANGAVYTVDGVQVRANASSLEGLPAGIYIFNGKKHLVK